MYLGQVIKLLYLTLAIVATLYKKDWHEIGRCSVVEHLPNRHGALGSNPKPERGRGEPGKRC